MISAGPQREKVLRKINREMLPIRKTVHAKPIRRAKKIQKVMTILPGHIKRINRIINLTEKSLRAGTNIINRNLPAGTVRKINRVVISPKKAISQKKVINLIKAQTDVQNQSLIVRQKGARRQDHIIRPGAVPVQDHIILREVLHPQGLPDPGAADRKAVVQGAAAADQKGKKMMKVKTYIGLFIILSFFSGCYVMTEHPAISAHDEIIYREGEIFFADNCGECHSQGELIDYGYLVKADTAYYEDVYSLIDSYYNSSAWWYDFDFYMPPVGEEYYQENSGGYIPVPASRGPVIIESPVPPPPSGTTKPVTKERSAPPSKSGDGANRERSGSNTGTRRDSHDSKNGKSGRKK